MFILVWMEALATVTLYYGFYSKIYKICKQKPIYFILIVVENYKKASKGATQGA